MAFESLIEDIDLVQGDSSPIWFFGLPDSSALDGGAWSGRFTISTKFGDVPIVDTVLPFNSGTGQGDSYLAGTKFVFQIIPAESSLLYGNTTYDCAVELTNTSINFNNEVARFKIKCLTGN